MQFITEGIFLAVVAFASTFGGLKVALNGMREDVREIKGDVKEVKRTQAEHGERLAAGGL